MRLTCAPAPLCPCTLVCAVFTGFPSEKTTCDVCFEWALEGAKDNYYNGDVCDQALGLLKAMLDHLDAKGEC